MKQRPREAEDDRHQFIIQVHLEDQHDLDEMKQALEESGVTLDVSYGPYNVNPREINFVLRGWATPRSRSAAEEIPGVRFFGDPKLSA